MDFSSTDSRNEFEYTRYILLLYMIVAAARGVRPYLRTGSKDFAVSTLETLVLFLLDLDSGDMTGLTARRRGSFVRSLECIPCAGSVTTPHIMIECV